MKRLANTMTTSAQVLTVEHQIYADLPPAKDVPKFDVAVAQKQLIANSEPGQVRKGRIQEGPPLSFRSLTGPIQWLAGSTRTGCLGLIGQQRERHRASLLNSMPPWTTQLTFQDVAINQVATTIVGYADSSWANAAQCASQQGCIALLTMPLCTQVITKGNIVDWRSNRSSRVCRSTLAAESIACDDCVDRAHYVLLVLNELLTGTAFHRDPKKWKLQQPQVTDCRSLFDAVSAENPRTAEKRTHVYRHQVDPGVHNSSTSFWCPTNLMWADGLTKCTRQLRDDMAAWLKRPFIQLKALGSGSTKENTPSDKTHVQEAP